MDNYSMRATPPSSIPPSGLLTIDCQAICANWSSLRERAFNGASTGRCGAVVKADAYGLGVEQVARALFASGCQVFFVASLDEGVELRALLGPEPAIYVFSGLHHGMGDEWQAYQLIPVIVDQNHLLQWLKQAKKESEHRPYAIKLDTGMGRMGLMTEQFSAFLDEPDFLSMPPVMVMSHLACADEPEHPMNAKQNQRFADVVDTLRQRCPGIQYSLANSAGILLGERYSYDLVRPGIGLYGGNPRGVGNNPMSNPVSNPLSNPMRAVVALSLAVVQRKVIRSGESVGYGATFVAERDTPVAIVYGGYHDGLLRALGNRGQVYYQSYRLPIVGRISMDSFAVDLSGLPEAQREAMQAVEVLGKAQGVDTLAQAASTSSYEMLTSLGPRYQRQYLFGSENNE